MYRRPLLAFRKRQAAFDCEHKGMVYPGGGEQRPLPSNFEFAKIIIMMTSNDELKIKLCYRPLSWLLPT